MNKVLIVGRMAAEPIMRSTQNNISVCEMRIAVPRRNDKSQSDFFTVIAWRGLADLCAKYLEKGQRAAVCGSLCVRSYEDKQGNKRYATEIIADEIDFLDKAGSGGSGSAQPRTQEEAIDADGFAGYEGDLPF